MPVHHLNPAAMKKVVSRKTARLIESDMARTALWYMADYLPALLIEMAETRPEALLKDIEEQVSHAMQREQTMLERGTDPDVAREIANELLKPSWQPEDPEPIFVTEEMMQEIIDILIKTAKTTK